MLTQALLKEKLHYNPETGEFINLKSGKKAGWIEASGYIRIQIDTRKYMAHRLAWLHIHGVWPKYTIDHINNDRSDNRLVNLREATLSQNFGNTRLRAYNSSGYKGVYRNHKRWQARIKYLGKIIHLGTFETPEKAHDAYKKASDRYYGEFANYG